MLISPSLYILFSTSYLVGGVRIIELSPALYRKNNPRLIQRGAFRCMQENSKPLLIEREVTPVVYSKNSHWPIQTYAVPAVYREE